MNRKQKHKLSRVLRDLTKNRNFGINMARKLFPTKKVPKPKSSTKNKSSNPSVGNATAQPRSKIPTISVTSSNLPTPPPMAWLDQ